MWSKIGAFFKGFFGNVAADPVSSLKGVVQLAASGAACYGMATGVVPVNVGAPMAASFAASGIHALGTNSQTGVESAGAAKTEALINQAAAAAPVALSVVDQVAAIKAEADAGQKKIETYQAIASALAAIVPAPVQPPPPAQVTMGLTTPQPFIPQG